MCSKKTLDKTADLEKVSGYALTEIGLILSLPGFKFGHTREKSYDEIASLIHQKYNIGKFPQFIYSSGGLEFISDKNTHVEPYSSIQSKDRLLLTDSKRQFKRKINRLNTNNSKKIISQLGYAGLKEGESIYEFYERKIHPTKRKLTAKKMFIKTAASIAAGITMLASTIGYVNADAKSIRQAYMGQISPFGLNGDIATCNGAIDYARDSANLKIKDKYYIQNYFN